MITEDYVSFETAKLLKEKGFDWEVHRSYLVNDNVFIPGDISDVPLRKDAIRIPTLQSAMKWLREVHNIYIDIRRNLNIFNFRYLIQNNSKLDSYSNWMYHSYEEACEESIRYCVKNLI